MSSWGVELECLCEGMCVYVRVRKAAHTGVYIYAYMHASTCFHFVSSAFRQIT